MRRLFLVVVLLALAFALVACKSRPPAGLVPKGAKVLRELPAHEEQCFTHHLWTLETTPEAVGEWAATRRLPCVDDANPCVHWSTTKSRTFYWQVRGDEPNEPNGQDKLDATFGKNQLTIDWGDYTCSGWN